MYRLRLLAHIGLALASIAALSCHTRPKVELSAGPTVAFEAPAANSYLHGSVPVQVKASGIGKISSFTFDAPTSLQSATAALGADSRSATLSARLDLSSFPDGPLKLTATAHDDLGGVSTAELLVNVAAKAPTISIGSPAASSVLKGASVGVSASATAQAGATITKLELVSPPGGMGANTSAAAAEFLATWDTTAALEGPTALHFRATDSTGLTGDASINVTVDNVPLGTLDVYVFAGAPVKDATVEVWALSDSTGAVDTSAGTDGLLGSGGPTDASGRALVTLNAENYSGPIQLRAKPASGTTLQYVDPSDPDSGLVQIPSNVTLTSIVPSYAAGSGLGAPVTLATTLADAEVLAYAGGRHRLHPTQRAITAASAFGDVLFTQHLQASTPRWSLRSTVPVDLTAGPTTLTDRTHASLIDVALNQLARDLSAQSHVTGVITAPFLVAKLSSDLGADGQLDGKGAGGAGLTTEVGSPPYAFDANTFRVRLAQALDEWIVTARNKSTLDRSTLAGASIYSQISNDTSELFGSAPPIPFDNAAPQVVAVVTYGPSSAPPFNGTFVSGTVKVVVTATDPSGVKGVSLRLANLVLDSGASVVASADGKTVTYTASVDTTKLADLSYPLLATTVDQQNNTGSTTLTTLTVDNTPPTISPAQPSSTAFYSGTVPFEATASDGAGAGVASLTATGFTGLSDGDSAISHFLGTWAIPAAIPDGTATGAWVACDAVGNCTATAATPVAVRVDRTAPTVAFDVTPPATSQSSSAAVRVFAQDASGISRVWVSLNGGTPQAATLSGTDWSFTFTSIPSGSNTIVAWAEDTAQPTPNSGNTAATPSQASFTFIRDVTPPAPAFVSSFASYRDERGLRAVLDGSGRAVVPASYAYASSAKVTIPATGGHVYRSASRLSWATAPSAAELEGANLGNVPTLQFAVPFNSTTDASIASATASVSYGCAGCAADQGVALWPSARVEGGTLFYDLPLSANVLPGLLALTGPSVVAVSLNLVDAAGNSSAPFAVSFTFHPIGGAVGVVEDAAYAATRDLRSSYPYTVLDGSYSLLFDAANPAFLTDRAVRLERYVISNPEPVPVAISLPAASTWSMSESWTPEAGGSSTTTTTCYTIDPNLDPPPSMVSRSAASAPLAFLGFNIQGAVETGPAKVTASSEYIVPAATPAGPGLLVLYAARPTSALRDTGAGGFLLTWSSPRARYENPAPSAVSVRYSNYHCCGREGGVCLEYGYDASITTTSYTYVLAGAQDRADLPFSIGTYGVKGSARFTESNSDGRTYSVPTIGH